jgi:hypothetical protein
VHEAHAPPSSWHSNVLPLSLEVNATEALVDVPLDGAEVIVVSGGWVSGVPPPTEPDSTAPASGARPAKRALPW